MNDGADRTPVSDVREARSLFPATDNAAYFNTAAVGLASRALVAAYRSYVDDWAETGLDYFPGRGRGRKRKDFGSCPDWC
jgi:hypothetical protein